jgi:hypothetical protein
VERLAELSQQKAGLKRISQQEWYASVLIYQEGCDAFEKREIVIIKK